MRLKLYDLISKYQLHSRQVPCLFPDDTRNKAIKVLIKDALDEKDSSSDTENMKPADWLAKKVTWRFVDVATMLEREMAS